MVLICISVDDSRRKFVYSHIVTSRVVIVKREFKRQGAGKCLTFFRRLDLTMDGNVMEVYFGIKQKNIILDRL